MTENSNSNGTKEPNTRAVDSYPDSTEVEMAKYGIIQKQIPSYSYRDYRYGSLIDALAQAKRDEKAGRL